MVNKPKGKVPLYALINVELGEEVDRAMMEFGKKKYEIVEEALKLYFKQLFKRR